MFEILNDLKPFFEDCYRRVSVREYAKLARISPATASRLLAGYAKKGLLIMEKYRNYKLFYANKKSRDFIDFSRIYWRHRLQEFADHAERKLTAPVIILFGSLSKGEAKADSDIDIAIFAGEKKLSTDEIEKKTGRKMQIFWFESRDHAERVGLANAVLNGYLLKGKVSWTGKNALKKA